MCLNEQLFADGPAQHHRQVSQAPSGDSLGHMKGPVSEDGSRPQGLAGKITKGNWPGQIVDSEQEFHIPAEESPLNRKSKVNDKTKPS